MNKSPFSGTITALITPFLNGKVNYPMMEQLLKRQMDAGIRAVVVCGTTGEAPTLSDEEKLEIIRRSKAYTGHSCAIIAGTGSNDTAHSAALSAAAQRMGADGVLVVTPYYNKATQSGLIAHFQTIADGIQIPMILYNVPSRTGVDLPVSVCEVLCHHRNIIGIKEACTDLSKVTALRNACGPDFSIWSGNDELTVPFLSMGANGVISVLSNVCPTETDVMVQAGLDGDFDTAAALQCQLQPLIDLLFCEVNPIPVKAAMRCIGYDCGNCRLPLTRLLPEHQKKLEDYLR